jgi:DNA-binding winged helix-turn-helix (wHTH) protein
VADEPIYIETILKRGYRFVAPVTNTAARSTYGEPGRAKTSAQSGMQAEW